MKILHCAVEGALRPMLNSSLAGKYVSKISSLMPSRQREDIGNAFRRSTQGACPSRTSYILNDGPTAAVYESYALSIAHRYPFYMTFSQMSENMQKNVRRTLGFRL